MLKKYMTKKQVENSFKEFFSDFLTSNDYPAKQFAWATFIDSLCKDGQISQKQFDTWGNPKCIGKPC